jgi:hypothetical protein
LVQNSGADECQALTRTDAAYQIDVNVRSMAESSRLPEDAQVP